MTIDELTDRIVEWEGQRSPAQSSPDRRQVREELHDVDLPALDDRGAVTFNTDEGIVGSGDAERDPRSHLESGGEPGASSRKRSVDRTHLAVAVAVALISVVLTALVLGETVAAVLVAGLVVLAALYAVAYRVSQWHEAA